MTGPPPPIVKVPSLKRFGGLPPRFSKVGRGYSISEIKAAGLTVNEARLMGIYVDERRRSMYEENVKNLREWLKAVKLGEVNISQPTLLKVLLIKPDRGRVFKGKTMAGRRTRGLLSDKHRYTHNYKWAKKQRERSLRKRHEAVRHKGGH